MSAIATVTTMPAGGAPDWVPSRVHRLTVEEYERMAASGSIPSTNRTHLINGYLVDRMGHNPPHANATQRTGVELLRAIPPGWHVRPALPVRLPAQASLPEPDHCVTRGSIDDYAERHPGAADVALVVEVADSSLAEDRDYAARLYGPAGIPACWIVDVNARHIEVYSNPGPAGYGAPVIFGEGQSVPLVLDGREVGRIAVAALLPPAGPRPE